MFLFGAFGRSDRVKTLGRRAMTFKIDGALVAAFAVSFLSAFGASAKAETVAGDGKQQAVTESHSHHAYAAHRLHKHAAALPHIARGSFRPYYGETRPRTFTWGAPPLQDPRDAYHGYFANPLDDPHYYGSGRTTLIFR